MKKTYEFSRLIKMTLVMLLFVTGCAGKDLQTESDKVFTEWKTKAETSQGHSPAPIKRQLAKQKPEPERVMETAGAEAVDQRLPREKISLTMHGAEIPAVLRALARAVDQNIMINESVRGRIDVSLKAVSWDQAFRSILRTYGLTYLWEGNIVRVVTIEDKNRELELRIDSGIIDIPAGPGRRSYAKARFDSHQLLDGSWRIYYRDRLIAQTCPSLAPALRTLPRPRTPTRAYSPEFALRSKPLPSGGDRFTGQSR